MLDDGILDRDVFESVRHAKRAVIEHTGVLEYFPSDERLDEVAGLGALSAGSSSARSPFASRLGLASSGSLRRAVSC